MRELVLEDTVLSLKYKGEVYKMTFPCVGERIKLAKDLEKEGCDSYEILSNFFQQRGLSKKALESFEESHLTLILEEFSNAKK